MTQEEKKLLLKDLCARLPYGVMCNHSNRTEIIANVSDKGFYQPSSRDGWHSIEEIKPYLRPMSSMTEDEKEYIKHRWCYDDWTDIHDFLNNYKIDAVDAYDFIDWLNVYHFDYHGLITKGLALETLEGMYNIK